MSVLTAKGISQVAINLLTRSLVLPRTVTRIPGTEFNGDNGDTITVRVPQPGIYREQETPGADITFDDTHEVPVDVQMKDLYNAHRISSKEMQLDIEDFSRQVTRVQVDAVATGAEDQLAGVMNALSADDSDVTGTDDVLAGVGRARTFLGRNNAPASGRWLAVSPEFAELLLETDALTDASQAGSASALRDAVIGRLRGFNVVESNGLDEGTAVAYHQSGFCFANATPPAADGALSSAVAAAEGIGLMQVLDWIPTKLSHASTIETFAGAAAVYDVTLDSSGSIASSDVAKRFYKLEIGSAGSV